MGLGNRDLHPSMDSTPPPIPLVLGKVINGQEALHQPSKASAAGAPS